MSRMFALLAVAVLVIAGWTSFSGLTPVAVPLSLRADGAAQRIGNGTVRTYVLYDPANRRVPIEVGIALSERALEGLPAPMQMEHAQDAMSSHFDTHERLLELPAGNPTPYTFVQFNWNPGGHEPPGIYDRPHFDFHFWTVPVEVRNGIVPSTPQFAEKAASYPGEAYRTPFYVDAATAAKAPAAAVTVPQMGMHWLDVRSPEFNGQGFSKTYIIGSWDGRFVFDEPMITRAHIVAKRATNDAAVRDEVILLPKTERRQIAGYYPEAYRITYDAERNEYRIALTRLTWQK
jgi:hypothetical protein